MNQRIWVPLAAGEAATASGGSAGRPRAYLSFLEKGYRACFEEGLEYLGVSERIGRGDRVAIKPNLTFPHFRKGVMTNPAAVEALLMVLADRGARITICESDSGGYNAFSMDEVFRVTGLTDIARKVGAQIVNLSGVESRAIEVRSGLRRLQVPLPKVILDETEWFVSMPVPKVHSNTILSLSIKNQWGVIQEPALRLKLHPYFTDVIHAVTRALPRPIAVMDGRYGLDRSGPMRGDVVEMGWTLMASDLYTCDLIASQLMGVPHRRVPHLKTILAREGRQEAGDVETNVSLAEFSGRAFCLERKWTDVPGLLTFHSRLLAYVGYESPLAKPLHWLLYRFREPFY